MSKLLIDDYPLQVLPSLAIKVGLNEAIILQQIHYWLNASKFEHDGVRWVYNTVKQWSEQFPFWSDDTISRALKHLRDEGILVAERLGSNKFDKTLYYTIDYGLLHDSMTAKCGIPMTAKCGTRSLQSASLSITETTTETTSEIVATELVAQPAPAAKPRAESKTAAVWQAYASAYQTRYNVEPVRNSSVNGKLSMFVNRIPAEDAPHVAAFFVRHNGSFYVQKMHPVGLLLQDAESLHTQWRTNRTMTATKAAQVDKTQTNLSVFAGLRDELCRGASNGF